MQWSTLGPIGSMRCATHFEARMRHIIHGGSFQVTQSFVQIFTDELGQLFGLENGLTLTHRPNWGRHQVRHPTLPLMFEYPEDAHLPECQIGNFFVTNDSSAEEEKILTKSLGQHQRHFWNKNLKTSQNGPGRKRASRFENSVEDEEENFVW